MTTKITGDNITDGSVTTDDLNAAAKSSGATDGNAFNIGVLGFKIAVNEGLTIFNLVDGIVDEFNTMAVMPGDENHPPYRAFVCHTLNEWNYPAKDRSGRLDLIEEPHLGKLLQKMSGKKPISERPLNFDLAKKESEVKPNA